MQTVVLAAGRGTRMGPLTNTLPKPMLPVAGRPLVEHTVEAAVDAGATHVVIVVGYESAAVRDHFGEESFDVPVSFARQPEQRGTGDAVRSALPELDPEPFVVLNGDALYDRASLRNLYETGPAVGSYRVPNPEAYGVLRTAGDRVTGVVEKPAEPPSDLINTGAYAFPAAAREWLDVGESERGEIELTAVLQRACEQATVQPVPFTRWLDVGRPWELLAANEWKLPELGGRRRGEVSDDAHLDGTVVVAPGATIRPGVVIEGPAYIGRDASVGPNAYVRGATILGPDTKVGHSVEVKNSVVMRGTSVGHLSYVGDSVLGEDVNFGAGTVVANLRHDDSTVRVTVKGDRVDTARRKFGVVCGPGAKTGINTSLNAGVTLAEGARTSPGEAVTRDR
jgi:bifunctional UDP-N-acetylglucosamine pyrophosphorylase/glucosamine-1-phosphate N-acetyltransferase